MTRASVFGKLPSQADFFREGPVSPPVHAAEKWIVDAWQALREAGLDFPSAPARLVFARPEWAEVVVALAVGSRDSVGRSFPLTALLALDAPTLAGRGWLLPLGLRGVFASADGLLCKAAEDGDAAALTRGLAAASPWGEEACREAAARFEEVVRAQPVSAFEGRIFEPRESRYYAYRTLRVACDGLGGRVPDPATTVLGCPIQCELDVAVWSAIVARVLRWPTVVPMAWVDDPDSRLLVSLGPMPLEALRFLVDATTDSMRYWPLTTTSERALASAAQELECAAAWSNPGDTLEQLIDRVSRFRPKAS